jgi:hypothetical protein
MSKFDELIAAKKPPGKRARRTDSQRPRRGRPPGKRSDPDFQQITAYVRRDTHQAVKLALLRRGEQRDFSDLVEELLGRWVSHHKDI